MTKFNFEVVAPDIGGQGTFTVTLRVPVATPKDQSKVLHYIRGIEIKNDFMNGWVRENAAGYGIEIRGGPRPVFADPQNRGSVVSAYEQDFRLTRHI